MTRVLAALLLAQFAPTLATHGRRRLHLISTADVSSITSSATTTTSPSSAFDLLPSTHWPPFPPAAGARANMTALRSFFARGEHPSPPMEVRAGKLAENVTMQRL